MNKLDKIEAAMRYVYAHFLEEGEDVEFMVVSQKQHISNVRHTVRHLVYWRMAATLKQVGQAEGRIKGNNTDTSTILSSLRIIANGRIRKEAITKIDILMDEFEDYWNGFGSPILKDRITYFNRLPRHVLAMVLSLATEYGYAERAKIDGLVREFKTQPKRFIKKLEKL